MATKYLDIEGGNDSNDGSSFANRVKTFSRASDLVAAGDTLRVMAAPAVVSLGTNLTWVDGSGAVTPAATQWTVLDDCESGWTASANITLTYSTTCKVGSGALSIAVGAAFTTGKAAYKAVGTLNLSSYQQLSFWLNLGSTNWPSNVSIKLCSDTTGDTPVDTITIPSGGYAVASIWNQMLIDKGSAFGSSIQSIAVYIDSDVGAQTLILDNIVAVKSGTGEISVRHLVGQPDSIGAGGSDTENWYPIRGFTATQILLDATHTTSWTALGSVHAHRCTAGTLAGKVQLLPNIPVPSTSTPWDTLNFIGITISGGWDRTNMSSQSHHSWLSWAYYNSTSQQFFSRSLLANVTWERVHFGQNISLGTLNFINSTVGKLCASVNQQFSIYGENCTFTGLYISTGSVSNLSLALVNGTVSDLMCYTTIGGQTTLTLSGYGATITCNTKVNASASQMHNILTSLNESYGIGYISTLLRRSIVFGTVGNSATTTSIPTSSLSPACNVADQFKNRIIVFDRNTATANLRGQFSPITSNTAGGTLTVSGLTTAPSSSDTFVIV